MWFMSILRTPCLPPNALDPSNGASDFLGKVMPDRYLELEGSFGGPSSNGFGSAVFRRPLATEVELETVARGVYETFVGKMWSDFGPEVWLANFVELASRGANRGSKILDILRSLEDPTTRSAAALMLDGGTDPEASAGVLERAFDHAAISELRVFAIGDGGAMSGLIIASRDTECMEDILLSFLMD